MAFLTTELSIHRVLTGVCLPSSSSIYSSSGSSTMSIPASTNSVRVDTLEVSILPARPIPCFLATPPKVMVFTSRVASMVQPFSTASLTSSTRSSGTIIVIGNTSPLPLAIYTVITPRPVSSVSPSTILVSGTFLVMQPLILTVIPYSIPSL